MDPSLHEFTAKFDSSLLSRVVTPVADIFPIIDFQKLKNILILKSLTNGQIHSILCLRFQKK